MVPVGTVEAHGALPLGTDTLIPENLAEILAPKFDALIAPSIPYGVTNSLLPYPGSTTVSSATFRAYLLEACAGLVDAGFRRVVILNGHGGQSSEVADVVARLWNEKKAFAAAIEWWGMAADASKAVYGERTSGHAGVEESAMVIAIDPTLVDAKALVKARRVPRRFGVRTRPFPATIILDKPEQNGDGAPDPDPKKARKFEGAVVKEIEVALNEVFEGWGELGR
ncbi:MAG TPA: creatininase family protein [Candidatus Polarisedimenticolaceae bacterium]